MKLGEDFLDIPKVFDKVWHEGLLCKMKQNGISDDGLNLLRDFFYERCFHSVFYLDYD